MKRVLRLLTLVGAVAGAVWYARQHAEPEPATPAGEWTPRPQLRAVPDAEAAPEATELVPEVAARDDLTAIKGIGPVYAAKLNGLGIETFAALAGADPVELAAEFDPRAAVQDWITDAKGRVAT